MILIKPVLPVLALLSVVHDGAALAHERKLSSAKAFKDSGKASKKSEASAKAAKAYGGETVDAKAQKVSKASKSKATKFFKSKSAKSGSETPPADEAHSEKSVDYEPLNTRTDYRPELVNEDYWHPKSSNFEIIDWEKWESTCGNFNEDKVYDPPQREDTPTSSIEGLEEMSWWQRSQLNFPQNWATSSQSNIGMVSDDSLDLYAALLGPNPDSSLVPEPFRNNLFWMQDNDASELLVSFNRGAWRANTPEGRPTGLYYVGSDWTHPPNVAGKNMVDTYNGYANFQVSPNGKWIKFSFISVFNDPSDPESTVAWFDMYIVQEGDEFTDRDGNVMTDVKPGDIVRYTFGRGDPYDCDPGNYSFQYIIRKVAQLDETTGKISPNSPHHDRLVDFVGAQPPAELHLQTLGFTNAASMTQAERWDFQVKYLSDYQMYASSPTPPHGDLLEFDRDGEGKCGDGIVQKPEECDDGNTEDGDGCSAGCTVELSCDIQLFNLQYPTEERLAANDEYYLQDFAEYGAIGPLNFLGQRAEECGKGGANFASLGKLIIGEYSDIARYMQTPQVRGFFIGRGRTIPERLPPYFMLSLDDPGTGTEQGESGIHEILHDFAWYDTIGKAQARIDSDENTKTTLESFITRLISEVSDAGDDAGAVTSAAEQFIGRYMMKVIFDLDYDDDQVATLQMLWQNRGAALGGLFEGKMSDEQFAGIKQLLDITSADIAASPAFADYEPSEDNFNLSKEEWANELMYVVGIAALGGSRNLVNNLFSKMPSDYEVDATNHEEVANAVLEAGRIQAPVNNVNIILQEPTDFEISGEAKTFPAGTVVALSIGLGSMDEKVFPDPHTFDHTRNNLLSNVLTYNSVGFETGGPRVCPGKNIAFKMAMDVLKAWLQKE